MSNNDSDWLQFSDSEQEEINKEADKQEKETISEMQQNLHCQQYFLVNKKYPQYIGKFDEEMMFLKEDSPQKQYYRRYKEVKTVFCNLFLSELYPIIYFIIKNPNIKDLVFNKVAQNITIHALLSKLFPHINQHIFEIYGKSQLNGIEKVSLYNFSVVDLKFNIFKEEKVQNNFLFVFILQQTKFTEIKDMNYIIDSMMKEQIQIIKQIQPTESLLNFQLPYSDEKYEFFKGKIMYPICQSATSATCKLLFSYKDVDQVIQYDCTKYERQIFYYNTEYRVSCFENKQQLLCFDQCLDCSAIQLINTLYNEYVKQNDKNSKQTDKDIASQIMQAIPRQQTYQQKYIRCQDRKQNDQK